MSYEKVKNSIRTIPNFPIEGIMFRDITTLLQDGEAFGHSIDLLYNRYKDMDIDVIVGIESRGFIFGAALAYKLGLGFVPVRKKGKLPGKTIAVSYDLEYGQDTIEIHEDAIAEGQKVLVIDDLIATGGTVAATVELVKKLKGEIIELSFIVGLPELKGTEKLNGLPVYTMVDFEGH